jgi:hypothetical protein
MLDLTLQGDRRSHEETHDSLKDDLILQSIYKGKTGCANKVEEEDCISVRHHQYQEAYEEAISSERTTSDSTGRVLIDITIIHL